MVGKGGWEGTQNHGPVLVPCDVFFTNCVFCRNPTRLWPYVYPQRRAPRRSLRMHWNWAELIHCILDPAMPGGLSVPDEATCRQDVLSLPLPVPLFVQAAARQALYMFWGL